MATELSAARALNDAATPPRIPRAILEDRYDGLMTSLDGMESSKIDLRLILTLRAFCEGVARHPYDAEHGVDLVDECLTLIRECIISRTDELGLAR